MIKRNGDNRWTIDVVQVVQVLVVVASFLGIYFTTLTDIKVELVEISTNQINQSQLLEKHDKRIGKNAECIQEVEKKVAAHFGVSTP